MAKKTEDKEVPNRVGNPVLAGIEFAEIELGKIESNPWQPRSVAPTDDELADLMSSIKAVGQINAIKVRPHPTKEGRYQRADGAMRSLALGKLGRKTVLAQIV